MYFENGNENRGKLWKMQMESSKLNYKDFMDYAWGDLK